MATVSTTAADVRRYVDTDLSDADINDYITDAEDEALTFNDGSDFRTGELDRLVKFYAAFLIAEGEDAGVQEKKLRQGSRQVTIKEGGSEDADEFLRERIRANDPSGQLLSGREATRDASRNFSTT